MYVLFLSYLAIESGSTYVEIEPLPPTHTHTHTHTHKSAVKIKTVLRANNLLPVLKKKKK